MVAARVSLLGVALTLAAACGDNSGPSNQTGAMSATIDGTAWTSVAASAVRNVTNVGTITSVSGANSNGVAVAVAIIEAGVGTYPINATGASNALVTSGNSTWSASAAGGSGTITLSALDATHIAGTFSFTTAAGAAGISPSVRQVTNGSFNVQF